MASANWMKMTKQRAGSMKRHLDKYAREFKNHSNEHIDQSKSHLNTYIGCNDYTEAYQAMLQRVAEVDKIQPPQKNMKDRRIISCMIEIPCPLAIQMQGRDQEFFEAMYEEMQKYFGKENVHGMFVHRDEQHEYTDKDGTKQLSLYHGHTLLSAYTKEKGINGKAFETKKRLREFNKAIDERCKKQFGMPFNNGGIAHKQKVEELKKEEHLHELTRQVKAQETQKDQLQEDCFALADNKMQLQLDNQGIKTEIEDNKIKIQKQQIDINDNDIRLQNQITEIDKQTKVITDKKAEYNQINAEAKEAYFLNEKFKSENAELEQKYNKMRATINRRDEILADEKGSDYKTSKFYPGYILVKEERLQKRADAYAVSGEAKQMIAQAEKMMSEALDIKTQYNYNQFVNNRQKTVNEEKQQAYEQALLDVSKALGKPLTAIKSAIDLFNQVEQEADYGR